MRRRQSRTMGGIARLVKIRRGQYHAKNRRRIKNAVKEPSFDPDRHSSVRPRPRIFHRR